MDAVPHFLFAKLVGRSYQMLILAFFNLLLSTYSGSTRFKGIDPLVQWGLPNVSLLSARLSVNTVEGK